MRSVLITGVRGKTGAPLAELLTKQPDVYVRGGSSDPTRVALPDVYPVLFSWSDVSTWPPAVRDAGAVFIVRPDRADAPELIAELLALTSPQTHVVLLSEVDGGYFAPDDWAPRVEQVVRDSDRTWTVLRPGWFMQVFTDGRFMLHDLLEHGRLAFPSGGEPVSWIDTRDIAAVAARALLDSGHEGLVYELTGPEALTLPRTAELLSKAVGRPVQHVELTMEEALADSEGFARFAAWATRRWPTSRIIRRDTPVNVQVHPCPTVDHNLTPPHSVKVKRPYRLRYPCRRRRSSEGRRSWSRPGWPVHDHPGAGRSYGASENPDSICHELVQR